MISFVFSFNKSFLDRCSIKFLFKTIKMPSKLSDYDIVSEIGSGSYGKCVKIKRRSDGRILVWKDMDYGSMTESEKQQLVSEVNLLRELKHRYIVRYHDRVIDRSKSRLYLIMEFCSGGDLSTLISKCRKQMTYLDEEFIIKILTQTGLALQACHGQRQKSGNQGKVLHRDLKPANVFLDENQDVKLGDFGLARVLHHDTSFAKTFVGTPYYMSPEQMSKNLYNEKSDIWSLGCLVYELCALIPPFTAPNQRLLAEKIKQGQFRRIPSRYSDSLQSCISSMLQLSSTSRPSLTEILNLPLFKESVKKYNQSISESKPAAQVQNKEAKQIRNKPITSSSEETSPSALEAVLQAREKALEERIQEVERRESNVKRREKLVEDRERTVDLKMKTADNLIRQYRDLKLRVNSESTSDVRKQVHFADAKENAFDRYDDFRLKQYNTKLHSNLARRPFSKVDTQFGSRRALGMR